LINAWADKGITRERIPAETPKRAAWI